MLVIYYSVGVFFIVVNQKRIDAEMCIRVNSNSVPSNVRKFNIKLIFSVYLIFVVIINVK